MGKNVELAPPQDLTRNPVEILEQVKINHELGQQVNLHANHHFQELF